MIWYFIAGWFAGAIAMILVGKHYAEKHDRENNHEV